MAACSPIVPETSKTDTYQIHVKVQDMDRKVDKMERQLEELLALANRSKGGLWIGMSIASAFSAFVGFVASHWKS